MRSFGARSVQADYVGMVDSGELSHFQCECIFGGFILDVFDCHKIVAILSFVDRAEAPLADRLKFKS